jgi:hypothetical protein
MVVGIMKFRIKKLIERLLFLNNNGESYLSDCLLSEKITDCSQTGTINSIYYGSEYG